MSEDDQQAKKAKLVGALPTGLTHKNVPMPFFFRATSAEAFKKMPMKDNDVMLSSLPKGGTTWVNKILFSLLHDIDDLGQPNPTAAKGIGRVGQVYPEAIPINKAERDSLDEADQKRASIFGEWCLSDLECQPEPRLFSSHLFGEKFLPDGLVNGGKGRLVVVLRNLKDVLCSLHFFRGEAKDGWYGNEHGPGSLARFIDLNSPNAYGSPMTWIKEMDALVTKLQADKRVMVVYFEALKHDLPAQLDRLNSFLHLPPLTTAKRDAVAKACGFTAMKSSIVLASSLLRKGSIGDWKNHLDEESWAKFDNAFRTQLQDVAIARPLLHFQFDTIPGMPVHADAEQTLALDPRPPTWMGFDRVTITDGMVTPDTLIAASSTATPFVRPPSEFDGSIPSDKYPATSGRYHIFVSGVCPWASSVLTARFMLGLEDVVSVDVCDGQSGAGWVFLNGVTAKPFCNADTGVSHTPFFIHEVYQAHDSRCTTRITVPILWDTVTETIVSNDSWEIIKMFSDPNGLAKLATPKQAFKNVMTLEGDSSLPTLFPSSLTDTIETEHTSVKDTLLNGVYKAGIGFVKAKGVATEFVLKARTDVYNTLASLDERFSKQRFMLPGGKLTAVDVRVTMTLLRFDAAYVKAFLLQDVKGGGVVLGTGYPHLAAYVRDVYQLIKPTVRFHSFRQYYRWTIGVAEGEPLPPLEPIIAALNAEVGDRPTN